MGNLIRERREKHGWTQTELAARIEGELGPGGHLHQRAVSKWEKGESRPGPEKVAAVERVLDLKAGQIARLAYPTLRKPSGVAALSGVEFTEDEQRRVDAVIAEVLAERPR